MCALLLAAELRPLFTAGGRDPNGYVLTTAFVFALLLRYGLPVAVLVQAVATTAIDLSGPVPPGASASTSGSTRCPGRRRPR